MGITVTAIVGLLLALPGVAVYLFARQCQKRRALKAAKAPKRLAAKAETEEEEREIDCCRKNGYLEEEIQILVRFSRLERASFLSFWYRTYRCDSIKCPYCGYPTIELGRYVSIKPSGSARDVGVMRRLVENGFFCLKCGGESVCAEPGCKFRVGGIWPDGRGHYYGLSGHKALRLRRSKNARNLFDLLDELEAAAGITAPKELPVASPSPADEDAQIVREAQAEVEGLFK